MTESVNKVDIYSIAIIAFFVFVGIYILSQILSSRIKLFSLPRAYSIAVVGFPKSGKTCLITSIFGELFANRIAGITTFLRGSETIERVNADIAKLEIGRALGPTTDQDLFAYRAEIAKGTFPFKRTYKIEIGDFPGEHSKEFIEQSGEWFHNSKFFQWAMEANAIIFVVDLAHVLCPKERDVYIAEMKKAIRAAWHHLLEYHLTGKKNIKRMRIVLAFTKADLLVTHEQESSRESNNHEKTSRESNNREKAFRRETITDHIMKLGFGDTLPKSFYVEELSKESKSLIEEGFSDLIKYMRSQCQFCKVFVSVVAYNKNGRLGIRWLLEYLLPR